MIRMSLHWDNNSYTISIFYFDFIVAYFSLSSSLSPALSLAMNISRYFLRLFSFRDDYAWLRLTFLPPPFAACRHYARYASCVSDSWFARLFSDIFRRRRYAVYDFRRQSLRLTVASSFDWLMPLFTDASCISFISVYAAIFSFAIISASCLELAFHLLYCRFIEFQTLSLLHWYFLFTLFLHLFQITFHFIYLLLMPLLPPWCLYLDFRYDDAIMPFTGHFAAAFINIMLHFPAPFRRHADDELRHATRLLRLVTGFDRLIAFIID